MIIVFGSVNVDFVTRVEAIPRPGETVLGPGYDVIPGGKGANQALAARRAGAAVALAGAVGRDPFAEIGLALLKNDGVDLSATEAVDAPTGAAFITVDAKGENAITVASGCPPTMTSSFPPSINGVLPTPKKAPGISNSAAVLRCQSSLPVSASRQLKSPSAPKVKTRLS